jgi:two-component system, chemotaxis family, chemotaxis protein CheY
MRIFVVDDSRAMRTMITAYARELGCETAEAVDGQDGLEYLQKDANFDALLLDWDMPRMDGLTLLKALRADPRLNEVKIMMITAQGSYDCVAMALEAGANDYLMKPFDEQMFSEKMKILGLVA